jgi:hypothetical protein
VVCNCSILFALLEFGRPRPLLGAVCT